ncbi:MAG: addiction module protein [Acidobacteria bacterium]|nr:addiction module protein [Acidobacteriota bacterium]
MVTEMESLKNELLTLPVSARAWLAQNLLVSLDEQPEEEEETDAFWFDELQRRAAEIRSGQAICRPAADVLREAREQLRQ